MCQGVGKPLIRAPQVRDFERRVLKLTSLLGVRASQLGDMSSFVLLRRYRGVEAGTGGTIGP